LRVKGIGPRTYSDLKLTTGFVNAALTAWKLMVSIAIATAAKPPAKNIHQAPNILIR